jgi:hypothetical protein
MKRRGILGKIFISEKGLTNIKRALNEPTK